MKVIAIGDLHGRDSWEEIVKKEKESDKIVFIGDYFDTYSRSEVSSEKEIDNFKKILNFKNNYSDKVSLLIGNHELHYFNEINRKYSGFNKKIADRIEDILIQAFDSNLLQIVEEIDDVVYSHAGITKTWSEKYNINLNNLKNSIDKLFFKNKSAFDFQEDILAEMYNYADKGGNNIYQGPLWVRPEPLMKDRIDLKQVVGHTKVRSIFYKNGIAFTDVLEAQNQYLSVDDTKFNVNIF